MGRDSKNHTPTLDIEPSKNTPDYSDVSHTYMFSFSVVSSSSTIAAEAPDTAAITAITAPSTATPMMHPIKINTPVSDIIVHLLSYCYDNQSDMYLSVLFHMSLL